MADFSRSLVRLKLSKQLGLRLQVYADGRDPKDPQVGRGTSVFHRAIYEGSSTHRG